MESSNDSQILGEDEKEKLTEVKSTKTTKKPPKGGVALFGGADIFGGKNPFLKRKVDGSSSSETEKETDAPEVSIKCDDTTEASMVANTEILEESPAEEKNNIKKKKTKKSPRKPDRIGSGTGLFFAKVCDHDIIKFQRCKDYKNRGRDEYSIYLLMG